MDREEKAIFLYYLCYLYPCPKLISRERARGYGVDLDQDLDVDLYQLLRDVFSRRRERFRNRGEQDPPERKSRYDSSSSSSKLEVPDHGCKFIDVRCN
jgi:hypothetical protein